MKELINDMFRKSRGGYSRLLEIHCEGCGSFVCNYQKDGPGLLKRMYLDRITGSGAYVGLDKLPIDSVKDFACTKCLRVLGIPIVFKKEDRLAYRLFAGAITKNIVKVQ